ncbi:NUDIX domain-containing protein [Erythrobacter sp. NFXS35]|uniref:NUDIX domain-containing protein n=1 Tax=Erythrobacter sp. NFXS35 TaxID=2818436 RepID=UPI0032DE88F8
MVLHLFFMVTRGLTLGVRAVVRSDDGKFLLVRHTYTRGWHFPGGGVERGETAESALSRELRQETGLSLTGAALLHGAFFNAGISRRDHVLVYICDASGSLLEEPRSIEIAEVGYFDFHDLPAGTDLGTVRRMNEILEGAPPTATW